MTDLEGRPRVSLGHLPGAGVVLGGLGGAAGDGDTTGAAAAYHERHQDVAHREAPECIEIERFLAVVLGRRVVGLVVVVDSVHPYGT